MHSVWKPIFWPVFRISVDFFFASQSWFFFYFHLLTSLFSFLPHFMQIEDTPCLDLSYFFRSYFFFFEFSFRQITSAAWHTSRYILWATVRLFHSHPNGIGNQTAEIYCACFEWDARKPRNYNQFPIQIGFSSLFPHSKCELHKNGTKNETKKSFRFDYTFAQHHTIATNR